MNRPFTDTQAVDADPVKVTTPPTLGEELAQQQLPAALLVPLLQHLQLGIEPGAVHQACADEPAEVAASGLLARIGWLCKQLRLEGVQAAQLRWTRFDLRQLPALLFHQGEWGLVETADAPDQVLLTNSRQERRCVAIDSLEQGLVLWLQVRQRRDPAGFGWQTLRDNLAARLVWTELFRSRRWLTDVLIATVMINLLAVSTSLFAMQVYDRVVPTLAYATLTTLVVGMGLIIGLDWLLKRLRARTLDSLASDVDKSISQQVFDHVMHLRLDTRPRSLGTLSAQVGGLDAVRQFFSAAVVFSLIDLPFALLFILFIAIIGGSVAWVYLALLPVALLLGALTQWRLRHLLRQQMIRSNERQGLLVDAIRGTESIRSANAAWRFSNEWQAITESIDRYNLRQKELTNRSTISTGSLSTLAYVSAMVVGVLQIESGNLTMGGLIACSILGGRVIGPVAMGVRQLVQWQQVSQALELVHQVLGLEPERPSRDGLLTPEQAPRSVGLEGVRFGYGDSPVVQLDVPELTLNAGDRVVLLGPVGSGKSTLLKVLAGFYRPSEGRVRLGNADLWEIDPNLVSERVGYLPQSVQLFKGTLRSNLALSGAVNDERLLQVVQELGIDRIAADAAQQMNLPISEGGEGLSDGQRQLVGLARVFLAKPSVWLLDEPGASLDRDSEQRVIDALQRHLDPDDILVISTHRPMLAKQLANRVLVMQQGRISQDGSPEQVLPRLLGPAAAAHPGPAGNPRLPGGIGYV
jgi:ATP-binding cassette subfamily C protein LapB